MSEEARTAAGDLATVRRLTKQLQAAADEVQALRLEVMRLTILWQGQSRLTHEAQERAERAAADAAALRELYQDIERWREGGGDARDLQYVLETADRIRPDAGATLLAELTRLRQIETAARAYQAAVTRLDGVAAAEQALFAALAEGGQQGE